MKRSPLKKMGKDKARETRKYWPLRRKFLDVHQICEIPPRGGLPSCTKQSVSIHHSMGQNWRIMNDTRWWWASCSECHTYVEDHKNWAREKGVILYK